MTKFPTTFYMPMANYLRFGWIILGDVRDTLDDAANECTDAMSKGDATEWRVLRLDFDPDTGAPERTTDVTEEAAAAIRVWLDESGREYPEWLECAA